LVFVLGGKQSVGGRNPFLGLGKQLFGLPEKLLPLPLQFGC
jgi:hypothetical protein